MSTKRKVDSQYDCIQNSMGLKNRRKVGIVTCKIEMMQTPLSNKIKNKVPSSMMM